MAMEKIIYIKGQPHAKSMAYRGASQGEWHLQPGSPPWTQPTPCPRQSREVWARLSLPRKIKIGFHVDEMGPGKRINDTWDIYALKRSMLVIYNLIECHIHHTQILQARLGGARFLIWAALSSPMTKNNHNIYSLDETLEQNVPVDS